MNIHKSGPATKGKWRKLPDGFRARFSFDGAGVLDVEWSPSVPQQWSPALVDAYRIERDAFLADVLGRLVQGVVTSEIGSANEAEALC